VKVAATEDRLHEEAATLNPGPRSLRAGVECLIKQHAEHRKLAKSALLADHLRGRSGISGMAGWMGKIGFETSALPGRRSASAATAAGRLA
jgi:hypothetical protein